MEKFILEINDFGRINKANLEVNKINIVGGVNASGKSTASKLLYCFLKANSIKRKDYVLPKVVSNLNYLIKYLEYPNGDFEKIPDKLTKENDLTDILRVYDEYEKKLNKAQMSEQDKDKKVEEVNNTIENDLFLIGTTIVEDKLQENVPETIKKMRIANIKVWMLTGDKMNTAYNIGLSCNLINKDMKIFNKIQ